MTRTITLLALGCCLVAGAAAISVLARDSVPAVRAGHFADLVQAPTSNRESKKDKLPVTRVALPVAEPEPATTAASQPSISETSTSETSTSEPSASEPLRQAFASDSPVDLGSSSITSAVTIPALPPKPKVAAKPPAQKSYTLLSDAQIAAIKGRLRLSSSQEYYWPSVEDALRAIARKIHATRQANAASGPPVIDPDSEEVQQLKSAAMPLLFQLREDQKQEVRSLARIIGLHQVAAQI
ncbi:hypothetical protein [Rhodopseudomonas palustris]|uniref:hypothetical protein n=1 Tax=Rhodopseudomonas palustris TaxID=1076 RepID=UPI0002EEA0EC